MDFRELQQRFISLLRERVRCGEITERGLGRLAGISQPHIHNVLKGKRVLSLEKTDDILRQMRLDVLDLIEPTEWREHERRR
ncbi:MAG TPA: hypothetical protein VLW65_01125 [Bryobacteraceae bacterium]|nr:hypothetical protein [Bryobacteraceae bacterium]